ncbi:uncharacterized protein LOC124159075 [Ischnura elegans]|uniref:uncharacterized protein LOC124159075 n=1 Tax=Ischnura elegans TaxID=197161 RepID=UPI001ED893EE|nr:uncharacterized protein LOC124159075 [Ischnura elegans]
MLLRIFYFAFLLFPSYASWYPSTKVSCDPEYEIDDQKLVPPKTLKVELQGYKSIYLLGICGITVLIYLTYTLKRHRSSLFGNLLSGCTDIQQNNDMSKIEKDEQQDKASFNEEKVQREEPGSKPPIEIVLPPTAKETDAELTLCEESRTEETIPFDNEPGKVAENDECELSIPDPVEICPTVDDDINIPENTTEIPSLDLPTSTSAIETESNQKMLENNKRTRSSECTTPKNNSSATKCKVPEVKSSPTKGNSISKLPHKVSKNSLASPKSAGRSNEAIPSPSRAAKSPTDTPIKKSVRKESSDSVSKDVSTTCGPCGCGSKTAIDKLTKEIELLKRRITAAEKGKREAIRDGDILQKGMVSIKSSLKTMTEENAKLKKELDIAKRDKTESVRRITAKWREKLSQLEEKMRLEVECASNKAESISSNVASTSSKHKQDAEDCPMKPPVRPYRWNYKPEPQETSRQNGAQPSSYGSTEGGITLGWVDEVRRKTTLERENIEVDEKNTGDRHNPSADLPIKNNQHFSEQVTHDIIAKSGENEIPETTTDDHPREDEWLDDEAFSSGNGENDPVLQDIISEATARLDDLRSTDVLDDQGADLGYQESSIPASEVGECLKSNFEEVAGETGTATQDISEEIHTTAEDSMITQDSGIEEPSPTLELNSLDALSVNTKGKPEDSSETEIGHKGGRFLTLRSKNMDSDIPVEISVAGKKSYTIDGTRAGTENARSNSKSSINLGKNGLASKTSEKICTTKPPVPKSTLQRAGSKNDFDLRSMGTNIESSLSKVARKTSGGLSAHRLSAGHIQDTASSPKYSSYTKMIDSSEADDSEGEKLMSHEATADKVNENEESDPTTLRNGSEATTQENQAEEIPVTEILHPSSNNWTAFEEENRCNVIDETRHRDQETVQVSQLEASDAASESNHEVKETLGTVTQEIMSEEMTGVMASMRAEQAEIEAAMNSINMSTPGQSISDMELEARKYIQDLISLSSTFSEEEKEAVEELLGGSFSGRSFLQNLSKMTSQDEEAPSQSAASDRGSTDNGRIPAGSNASTEPNSSTAQTGGTSASAHSATSLGQGFLTGKLKQCFVYDPQRLKDQNTDALKNFMQMAVAKKTDGNSNSTS